MIVINNRDYNIDQNNRDYDFGHNRAALHRITSCFELNCDITGRWLTSDFIVLLKPAEQTYLSRWKSPGKDISLYFFFIFLVRHLSPYPSCITSIRAPNLSAKISQVSDYTLHHSYKPTCWCNPVKLLCGWANRKGMVQWEKLSFQFLFETVKASQDHSWMVLLLWMNGRDMVLNTATFGAAHRLLAANVTICWPDDSTMTDLCLFF